MANELPYFKWYPADADTDEDFRAMTDAEVGFYLRCLNHSWLNKGIPADSKARARTLRVTQSYGDKQWLTVGKRFEPSLDDPARLINTRQEIERERALTKSRRATDSIRTRYERTYERSYERRTNEPPHALAGADCVSDFAGSFLELNKKNSEAKPGIVRASFAQFWLRWCELTKRKQRESYACQAWISVVEFDTEALALACLERYGASDEVRRGIVTNPDKWIFDQARDKFTGEWQSPDPLPPPNGSRSAKAKAVMEEALRAAREEEKRGEVDAGSSDKITYQPSVQNGAIPRRGRRFAGPRADPHGGCSRCGPGWACGRRAA